MVVLDIGANIGYHSLVASRLVGPTGLVLAVEPEPHNFRLLRRNIIANRLTNVHVANVAIGAEPGTAQLFCSKWNYGDHRLYPATEEPRRATTVRVMTLDQLLAQCHCPPVDFIKMDVQGFESQVVAGMGATLERNPRLTLLTEFWPYGIKCAGGSPERFFETFERNGFDAFTVSERGTGDRVSYADALTLLPPFDPAHPDASYINLVFRRTQ
jgi:FkbM family methyltransferase